MTYQSKISIYITGETSRNIPKSIPNRYCTLFETVVQLDSCMIQSRGFMRKTDYVRSWKFLCITHCRGRIHKSNNNLTDRMRNSAWERFRARMDADNRRKMQIRQWFRCFVIFFRSDALCAGVISRWLPCKVCVCYVIVVRYWTRLDEAKVRWLVCIINGFMVTENTCTIYQCCIVDVYFYRLYESWLKKNFFFYSFFDNFYIVDIEKIIKCLFNSLA